MSERQQKVEARAQEADGREMSRATEVGECLEFLPALSFLLSVQEERGTWAKRTISFALPFVHRPFCHFPSLRPPPILLDAGFFRLTAGSVGGRGREVGKYVARMKETSPTHHYSATFRPWSNAVRWGLPPIVYPMVV